MVEVLSWVSLTVFSVAMALFCVIVFGEHITMSSGAMEPYVYEGQTVYINKFMYGFFNPKVGNMVIFRPNGNENSAYELKRVVAIPGDTVQIINGYLYVNGLRSEYTDTNEEPTPIYEAGIASSEITLEEEEYFVMNDNREYSDDSRNANLGPVEREDIIGFAWLIRGDSGMKLVTNN